MALAQAANIAEKIVGHDDSAITQQDVSSFPSGGEDDTMKALVWMGKNKVEMGRPSLHRIAQKAQQANLATS